MGRRKKEALNQEVEAFHSCRLEDLNQGVEAFHSYRLEDRRQLSSLAVLVVAYLGLEDPVRYRDLRDNPVVRLEAYDQVLLVHQEVRLYP
jgi:hypothetical protein